MWPPALLMTVLGGSGTALQSEDTGLLSCRPHSIALTDPDTRKELVLPFEGLLSLEISGPGTVTTNAGMIGGGFGIEGALKGMLVAALVNKLTEKSTTNTFLRLSTTGSAEVLLHTSQSEPQALRLTLSRAVVHLEANKQKVLSKAASAGDVSENLARLHRLLEQGALTDEEYATAKKRLLTP
jgi:hypothetical protein